MPISELRLIKRSVEEQSKDEIRLIPWDTRGMYVLLKQKKHRRKLRYDVVYVGMARGGGGIRERLRAHARSRRKGRQWTHFSVFEVHDNIREEEIEELEGLFRHIYRKDTRANPLNTARGYDKLRKKAVRKPNLKEWWEPSVKARHK